MPDDRSLPIPAGYDADAHPRVASFAAQLDDQLAGLRKHLTGFDVAHLEWQPRPGVNTVGMLLAHLAIVDVWWITIAPQAMPPGPDRDAILPRILGIGMDDDGIPLASDGRHPETLRGKALADYLALLDAARASSHQVLRTWQDGDLARSFHHNTRAFTREWTLYHVLEHFSAHHGQILLLSHLMRDEGLSPQT